ncbi:MAG: hypothetical protein JNJ39_07785 [Blastocatellia bacterium]|nr:hypothetical protein [Blastocatellia bacterium]
MKQAEVRIEVGRELLRHLDRLVKNGAFSTRTDALRSAIIEGVARIAPTTRVATGNPGTIPASGSLYFGGGESKWPEY